MKLQNYLYTLSRSTVKKSFQDVLLRISKYIIDSYLQCTFHIKKNVDLPAKENELSILILLSKAIGIGDSIILLNFIEIISKSYQSSQIILVAKTNLFLPNFNNVKFLSINDQGILDKLESSEFDLVLVPEKSVQTTRMLKSITFKAIAGYLFSFKLFSNFSDQKLEYRPSKDSFFDKSANIIKILGLSLNNNYYHHYHLEDNKVDSIKQENFIILMIAPYHDVRGTSDDNYLEIIHQLLAENEEVILGGDGHSMDRVKSLNKRLESSLNHFCNESLENVIKLINQCKLMITHDCGPMHMALAYQKRVVSIWGPTSPFTVAPVAVNDSVYLEKKCHVGVCFDNIKMPLCQTCKRLQSNEVSQLVMNKVYHA